MLQRKKARPGVWICWGMLFFCFMAGCRLLERDRDLAPGKHLILNEISPVSTGAKPAWIELYNPSDQELKAQDYSLIIDDELEYRLPEEVPAIPPRAFVLLSFDGRAQMPGDYDFEDGLLELHLPDRLKGTMKAGAGQVAVYKRGNLVGFVAWGQPGSKAGLSPERHKIWRSRWFVPTYPSFGLYLPESKLPKMFAIGRSPGSRGSSPKDWAVYLSDEMTPGKPNIVPSPSAFTLTDGAVVQSEDIAFGWTGTAVVKDCEFQLARDQEFNRIVEEAVMPAFVFKPADPLPEGTYYYRVRTADRGGRKSAWSRTMKVVSKKMAAPAPSREIGAVEENELSTMVFKYQKKDTGLLCLDGCDSHLNGATTKHWDNEHPEAMPIFGDHGDMNCVRASTAMLVSYYGAGKVLSQDRIAYFDQEEDPVMGDGVPELDLAHEIGVYYDEVELIMEWAFEEAVTVFGETDPTFAEVQGWIDSGQPLMTVKDSHMRALNGYRIDDAHEEWVHIMDPWSGPRWETYDTWTSSNWGVWIGPTSAPNAREDEPGISVDSDGNGVMDFDEQIRFGTGRFDADSDNDGVNDKEDIYEYVFQSGDTYDKRTADFDADGVRKEDDPDNDGDSYNDGCEDMNGNGIYEPASGETDNFAVDTGLSCPSKPIHAIIVFDRSGSMVYPSSDPILKYDRAAEAATLFLDTWLATDVPAQTKVGLVFYDHAAHFDAVPGTDTTLDYLDETKRQEIAASFDNNRPSYGSTSIGGGILHAMGAQGFDASGIPADDQHRVLIVLTDGMENSDPKMDNPSVTQALVDNNVDGFVLGIGDEMQIDEAKLDDLADILNHHPASLARDLDAFELEKFFLQVLAETQGMEFSTDPVSQITLGGTKTHIVPVNPGAERATFVVVWNDAKAKVEFTLKDPAGYPVEANITRTDSRYQISTKESPASGQWTLTINASAAGASAPSSVNYSLMSLEKNDFVKSFFQIQAGYYLTGNKLKLVAHLFPKKTRSYDGKVMVHVRQPKIGLGTFAAKAEVELKHSQRPIEKGAALTPVDRKYLAMTAEKMKVPVTRDTITLNDMGQDGDEIPGDNKYTGIFKQTRYDGIYTFHFIASMEPKDRKSGLNREKVVSIYLKPRIDPVISYLEIMERKYRIDDELTYLKMMVIPRDFFSNLLGPGQADLLQFDAKQNKVLRVVDNLDGSYEVDMAVPGEYKDTPMLLAKFRHISAGGNSMEK